MLDKQVGSYRITQKLAQGGMGEVYIAQHTLMDRAAVVKVLHPKLVHDEEVVKRFLNEAQAAASINHPGIVAIYDLGRAEGQVFIVMERLHGETLAERIARAPIDAEHTVTLSKQLASALGAAHARNIVHRDLKPENIFVVEDPDVPGGERIKVLDFGVAKLAPGLGAGNLTAQGSIFGTPAYMAPEQCENAANVDHRADLYAIGCIMYEMLCGTPPFGKGGLGLLAAHLRDTPQPPSKHNPRIPADLENTILKLLAKKPQDRFQSSEELVQALGGVDLTPRPEAAGRRSRNQLAFAATVFPDTEPPTDSLAGTPAAAPALSPTTYRSASGQVDAQPEPRRRRRGGKLLAAMILAPAIAGAGAFFLMNQDSAPRPTTQVQEGQGTRDPATGQPVDEVKQGPEALMLAKAQAALDEWRWDDAIVAAVQVHGMAPEGTELHERAKEIQQQALMGQRLALTYETFTNAVASKNLRTAIYAYEQLPDDCPYRQKATQAYTELRDEWMRPRLDEARKYVDKARCSKLEPIAQEVGLLFPESLPEIQALRDECENRDKKTAPGATATQPDGQPSMDGNSGGDGNGGDATKPPENGDKGPQAGTPGTEGADPASTTGQPDAQDPKTLKASKDLKAAKEASLKGAKATSAPKDPEAKQQTAEQPAAGVLPKQVPQEEIKKILAGHKSKLLSCYKQHKLQGGVTVTFQITPKGKTKKGSLTTDPKSVELEKCIMVDILRHASFPAAQEATEVSYSLGKDESTKPRDELKKPRDESRKNKRKRPARSVPR